MANLPEFEKKEVASASVRITNAGDGLSAALQVEPEALSMGDEVYYVLKGVVSHIDHFPLGPASKVLERKHTVRTIEITRIPEEMAEPTLAEARERIEEAQMEAAREEERARGVERIPGTE